MNVGVAALIRDGQNRAGTQDDLLSLHHLTTRGGIALSGQDQQQHQRKMKQGTFHNGRIGQLAGAYQRRFVAPIRHGHGTGRAGQRTSPRASGGRLTDPPQARATPGMSRCRGHQRRRVTASNRRNWHARPIMTTIRLPSDHRHGGRRLNCRPSQPPPHDGTSPALQTQKPHRMAGFRRAVKAAESAADQAFSISRLIFRARSDSSTSLALARKASSPPR